MSEQKPYSESIQHKVWCPDCRWTVTVADESCVEILENNHREYTNGAHEPRTTVVHKVFTKPERGIIQEPRCI